MKNSLISFAAAAALTTIGCVATLDGPTPTDSDRAPWVALEGEALEAELAASPVREAPMPFVRLGLAWDADSATAVEFATSVDGDVWSEWQTPEVVGHEVERVDGHAAFVGVLSAGEFSNFYRVRGSAGSATYVGIEFLEMTLAESVEDGEEPGGLEPEIIAAAVNINSRSSWGARAPKCTSPHNPNRFTIHHTVTPTNDTVSAQARLRNIQAFHQDVRGWCDIGYQYLVSRDGRLWVGRGAGRLGSHVGGQNSGNIGIAFIGTYSTTSATSTQVEAAGGLIDSLAGTYGISISSTNIKGHRDRGSTSCPGDRLYGQIRPIIDSAKAGGGNGGGGGGGGGGTTPPAGGTTVKGVVYAGSDSSNRIAGATVTVGSRSATTSTNGYFEFDGVAGNTFEVTASAPGFASRTMSRAASGAETWASMSLSAATGTASVQGVVYRGSDSSDRVANASISLSSGETATADANGYFRIDGLAPAAVTITAMSGGDSASVTRTLVSGTATWGSVSL